MIFVNWMHWMFNQLSADPFHTDLYSLHTCCLQSLRQACSGLYVCTTETQANVVKTTFTSVSKM